MNIQLLMAAQRIPPAPPPVNAIVATVMAYPFPITVNVPASVQTAVPAASLKT